LLKCASILAAAFGASLLNRGVTAETPAAAQGRGFQSLDGQWHIAPDKDDRGRADQWYAPSHFPLAASRPISVPGNINEAWPNPAPLEMEQAANLDWYLKTFTPERPEAPGLRSYLRFGAVSFQSEIWLNGHALGSHEGGQDPFEYEVTRLLLSGQPNTLIVRVAAPWFGGIIQHVTLVSQPEVRIIDGFARPDAKKGEIVLEVTLENNTGASATVDLAAGWGEFQPSRELGSKAARVTLPPGRTVSTVVLPVAQPHLWSFDEPNLYTIKIASHWREAPLDAAAGDECQFRTGFRDFRIVNGYFCLNGKRVILKSTHGNWYDPVAIQGTARTMKYLDKDFTQLKKSGFNTLRLIMSAGLPELLDEADERGLMIYSEHETSWMVTDPAKFGVSLNQVVRSDRNHPSLVMWGLLNETGVQGVYRRAKAWLPSLRAIDDTRLIMLSSGRFDDDFKTASASNPGSATWNVYLGGEDPINPVSTGSLPPENVQAFHPGTDDSTRWDFVKSFEIIGNFHPGTGDAHIYQPYPTSWGFVLAFENLARKTKPFFLSEAGDGSTYNPFDEKREMERVGAPSTAYAWGWITPAVTGFQGTWKTFGLADVYPSAEGLLIDSALSQSRQRARTFSIVRSNPKVNGFNLTSIIDCWGTGEGFMDSFREFKPGELSALRDGWAPLRWCLLVNPTNVYAGAPLRVRVALANEDLLPGGDYPAVLKISGAQGIVWTSQVTAHVDSGADAPLAYTVFNQTIDLPAGLPEGTYTLSGELSGRANAAASELAFTVTQPPSTGTFGTVTVLGLDSKARDFLVRRGARVHLYAENERIDREVILVGDSFKGKAAAWQALYARCAQGAHIVFLAPAAFLVDPDAGEGAIKWLPLEKKGLLDNERDALYHKDIVARGGSAFAGLQTRLMTPEYYEGVLAQAPYFRDLSLPDRVEAVGIRCVAGGAIASDYKDGVVLGTYRFHAGHFTINGLNILGNLGNPAADRLLLNLVAEAKSDAVSVQPLPKDYAAEMASFGITDRP
jgi:hypothetical protein